MNVRIDAIIVRIRIATMWIQVTVMDGSATKNCNAGRNAQRGIYVVRNRFLVKQFTAMDMGTDAIIDVRIKNTIMGKSQTRISSIGGSYLVIIVVYSGANTALSLASKGWGRFASSI